MNSKDHIFVWLLCRSFTLSSYFKPKQN